MINETSNALIKETSPYLLQHAHNPVQWYPWGDEALQRAEREDKPILLSIGYSACHWCHVMAHESFEDAETAALMNELFVNIKVDREERPDLDKIYQKAHQLLARRPGGWPLTMFLMPDDRMPFFGGTYFPKEPRHQLPAFRDLLRRVDEVYHSHRDELRQQNQSLAEALLAVDAQSAAQSGALNPAPLDSARMQLIDSVDWQHGGFGRAPKFPHTSSIERLLRHWAASGGKDQRSLEAARWCLTRMGLGGVNDQLGGGFCRYSVDDLWMIPHFEKMLYDNGPLLALYSQAHAATGERLYAEIAIATAQWVMLEMQSPEGGFYSSLDADSEGEEGKFYVWTPDEARALLESDEYEVVARRYGLDREPNFEGHWHLHVFVDWQALAEERGDDESRLRELVESAKQKLLAARSQRVAPGRDDKVLTSWNALMIRGLAVAARHLQRDDFVHAAQRALDFIRATLWRDGRLLATYKDGRAHLAAYLDDYVFLIDAILELNQARWRDGDLDFALQLADVVLAHFEDEQNGGFYFTADDHERLIERPKPFGDESTPAGNGVAATVFGRLGHLLGETRYLDACTRTLHAGWNAIEQLPYAHCAMLQALEETLYPPTVVVLRGATQELQSWQQRCAQPYAPRRLSFAIPEDARHLPGLLRERRAPKEGVLAYVCEGTSCQAPTATLESLQVQLRNSESSSDDR